MSPLLLLALSFKALAQDGFNAHGFEQAPGDNDLEDPLTLWRPEAQVKGSWSANGLLEYASKPLVLATATDDGGYTTEPLLDNLVGLNLAGMYALHERVGVALSVPVWFTSTGADGGQGPALGDLRLHVPITALAPKDGADGVAVSVVPFADVPIGAEGKYLGNGGFGGGLVAAAGYGTETIDASLNVGVAADPAVDFQNLNGGMRLLSGVAFAYLPTDTLGIRLEANLRPTFASNEYALTEAPGEVIASVRGRNDGGLRWTAGASTAFTRGAGAAAFRVFAGVGYTFGKDIVRDADGDGLADDVDVCPTEPETINAYKDTDGCPDILASLTLTVKDEDGKLVKDASVTLGGRAYTTDAEGHVTIDGLMPEQVFAGGDTSHPFFKPATVADLTPIPGANEASVTLSYLPGKVKVITKSEAGAIVDATVSFAGPVTKDPVALGDDGQEVLELRPGAWRLLVSAEMFGTERVDLTINPGEASLVVIEVVLKPTKAVVRASEIKILEQVQFDFDKATIQAVSFPLLTQVANILLEHPELKKLEVQGHTDDKGNDKYNLDLSQRRVDSVVKFLVDQGVDASRLSPVGYGETRPVESNKTEKGRALNRRVQFIILDPAAAPETPHAP
jgi:outer membrane protein OmpA-like peptidoglycan-associated protein